MKEIRRGDVLLHLAPVRQLLVFPALGTSYDSYLFSILSCSFSRALQHLLVFPPNYIFSALGSSCSFPGALAFFFPFSSRVWCCSPVFQMSLFFTCFSRCSVEYMWDDIVFWGAFTEKTLLWRSLWISKHHCKSHFFLTLICPTLRYRQISRLRGIRECVVPQDSATTASKLSVSRS